MKKRKENEKRGLRSVTQEKKSVAKERGSVPHCNGEATLPSTRADCSLGGQHQVTKQARQPCPAHSKGRAQNDALEPREANSALPLWRAESGSMRKKIKKKISTMHATRLEQGTMRKPKTKGD